MEVTEPVAAYQFDSAVVLLGTIVESLLNRVDDKGASVHRPEDVLDGKVKIDGHKGVDSLLLIPGLAVEVQGVTKDGIT